jgi:sugar phosphate isomerase/epimerase
MAANKTLFVGCGEWGFRNLPVEEHFEIAKRLGFRHLEFGIGGDFPGRLSSRLRPDEVVAFRELSASFQIAATQCCLENDFTLPNPAEHREMLERTTREIALAARLGAKQIRLFAGFTPVTEMTEALWQQLLEAFRICQDLCHSLGLTIAIETHGRIRVEDGACHHEHTVSTDPDSLRRLLRDLPPEVGFNFDPGNLKAVAPSDLTYGLPILGERITYCHLKDWRRKGSGWEAVAIGDDDLDYGHLLPQMSYEGMYLIEYEPTEDVEAGIVRSLKYLKGLGFVLRFE